MWLNEPTLIQIQSIKSNTIQLSLISHRTRLHWTTITSVNVPQGGDLKTHRLCLVPGKYKGKKKNAKENDFLMFGCPMKNIKENQI